MMSTLLITHPACLDHLTPAGHPERPDRLRAIDRALETERFSGCAHASRRRALRSTRSRSAIPCNMSPPSARRREGRPDRPGRRHDHVAGRFRRPCAPSAASCTRSTRSWPARRRMPSLRRGPRSPRRNGPANGILLLQQRGHRRAPRAEKPRHRARWRWSTSDVHHGNGSRDISLVRPHACHVRLDPSDAALPRHRSSGPASAASTTPS